MNDSMKFSFLMITTLIIKQNNSKVKFYQYFLSFAFRLNNFQWNFCTSKKEEKREKKKARKITK